MRPMMPQQGSSEMRPQQRPMMPQQGQSAMRPQQQGQGGQEINLDSHHQQAVEHFEKLATMHDQTSQIHQKHAQTARKQLLLHLKALRGKGGK